MLIGRILNRFSKDTGTVDESLPNAMLITIDRIIFTIGVIIQILIINWWTIFPLLIMIYIFFKINDIYISTVQNIKRLEGNGKEFFSLMVNVKYYLLIFYIKYGFYYLKLLCYSFKK
jgi:ABC-type multidrug transport system fused ATPase/permease subunit